MINPRYKIQKISSSVLSKVNTGIDPFEVILKEAEKENLTPNLVRALCQNINNEMFLNHYNSGMTGKINIIDPEKVIDSLSMPESTTSAPVTDYWNPGSTIVSVKEADDDKYERDDDKNRMQSYDSFLEKKSSLKKETNRRKLYDSIIKKASEIQELKASMYKTVLRGLRNNEYDPNEVLFLSKTAADADVEESLNLAIEHSKRVTSDEAVAKIAEYVINDDKKIDQSNSIFRSIRNVLEEKEALKELITNYNKE